MRRLDQHSILCDNHRGFCCKHSSETSLIVTIHKIACNLISREQVDVILLFSTVSDKVPHSRLLVLHKLDL